MKFSWKKVTGATKAKRKISRKTGIPLTKSGRQRKVGNMLMGGKGCLVTILVPIFLMVLIVSSLSQQEPFPFQLNDLVNKDPASVAKILGKPDKVSRDNYQGTYGKYKIERASYLNENVEIGFIENGARWITIKLESCTDWEQLSKNMKRCQETKSNFKGYSYSRGESTLFMDLGLDKNIKPNFANEHVKRFKDVDGIYEISIFPIKHKIDYILVLSEKKYL